MKEPIIETHDVVFHYPDGTIALDKINLRFQTGHKVAVLGANGAGKSTLFLHFNGILRPRSGCLFFKGKEFHYKGAMLKELRSKIGIVFQDPDNQLFSASVYQELAFGPLNIGLPDTEVRRRIEQAMSATGITELMDKPTHMLSFGQKKRVAIAAILAMEPEVLVLDEPTSGLDPKHSQELLSLLNCSSQAQKTIILSTHDVDLAYSWADQVIIMSQGRVLADGVPQDVFSRDEVLDSADLCRPWLIDVHSMLLQKGLIHPSEDPPRTKAELFRLLSSTPG